MFQRLLVANRGEVAVRIARACRTLGIAPVGVASEADLDSSWTQAFDEVVCIGPAAAAHSCTRPAEGGNAAATTCSSSRPCGARFPLSWSPTTSRSWRSMTRMSSARRRSHAGSTRRAG